MLASVMYRAAGDTLNERASLVSLLRQDISGTIPFAYRNASARLAQVSTTPDQRNEARTLFDSLQHAVVNDPDFFRSLKATEP